MRCGLVWWNLMTLMVSSLTFEDDIESLDSSVEPPDSVQQYEEYIDEPTTQSNNIPFYMPGTDFFNVPELYQNLKAGKNISGVYIGPTFSKEFAMKTPSAKSVSTGFKLLDWKRRRKRLNRDVDEDDRIVKTGHGLRKEWFGNSGNDFPSQIKKRMHFDSGMKEPDVNANYKINERNQGRSLGRKLEKKEAKSRMSSIGRIFNKMRDDPKEDVNVYTQPQCGIHLSPTVTYCDTGLSNRSACCLNFSNATVNSKSWKRNSRSGKRSKWEEDPFEEFVEYKRSVKKDKSKNKSLATSLVETTSRKISTRESQTSLMEVSNSHSKIDQNELTSSSNSEAARNPLINIVSTSQNLEIKTKGVPQKIVKSTEKDQSSKEMLKENKLQANEVFKHIDFGEKKKVEAIIKDIASTKESKEKCLKEEPIVRNRVPIKKVRSSKADPSTIKTSIQNDNTSNLNNESKRKESIFKDNSNIKESNKEKLMPKTCATKDNSNAKVMIGQEKSLILDHSSKDNSNAKEEVIKKEVRLKEATIKNVHSLKENLNTTEKSILTEDRSNTQYETSSLNKHRLNKLIQKDRETKDDKKEETSLKTESRLKDKFNTGDMLIREEVMLKENGKKENSNSQKIIFKEKSMLKDRNLKVNTNKNRGESNEENRTNKNLLEKVNYSTNYPNKKEEKLFNDHSSMDDSNAGEINEDEYFQKEFDLIETPFLGEDTVNDSPISLEEPSLKPQQSNDDQMIKKFNVESKIQNKPNKKTSAREFQSMDEAIGSRLMNKELIQIVRRLNESKKGEPQFINKKTDAEIEIKDDSVDKQLPRNEISKVIQVEKTDSVSKDPSKMSSNSKATIILDDDEIDLHPKLKIGKLFNINMAAESNSATVCTPPPPTSCVTPPPPTFCVTPPPPTSSCETPPPPTYSCETPPPPTYCETPPSPTSCVTPPPPTSSCVTPPPPTSSCVTPVQLPTFSILSTGHDAPRAECHPKGSGPLSPMQFDPEAYGPRNEEEVEDALTGKLADRVVEVVMAKVGKWPRMMKELGLYAQGNMSQVQSKVSHPQGKLACKEQTCENVKTSVLKDIAAAVERLANTKSIGLCLKPPEDLADFLSWLLSEDSGTEMPEPSLGLQPRREPDYLFRGFGIENELINDVQELERKCNWDNWINFNEESSEDADEKMIEADEFEGKGQVQQPKNYKRIPRHLSHRKRIARKSGTQTRRRRYTPWSLNDYP